MTESAPDRSSNPLPPVRGAPILIVASLPPEVFGWTDALRRRHFPPERNRLGAHVTLFHGLPASAEGEVHRLLSEMAASHAPQPARIVGLMDLDPGTALAVKSPGMAQIHAEMAERLHGLIQQRDNRPLRLHITLQAKVAHESARALQTELEGRVPLTGFAFPGLATHRWDGELWRFERAFRFRGR